MPTSARLPRLTRPVMDQPIDATKRNEKLRNLRNYEIFRTCFGAFDQLNSYIFGQNFLELCYFIIIFQILMLLAFFSSPYRNRESERFTGENNDKQPFKFILGVSRLHSQAARSLRRKIYSSIPRASPQKERVKKNTLFCPASWPHALQAKPFLPRTATCR